MKERYPLLLSGSKLVSTARSRGLTLIEMTVFFAIVAIGITATLSLFVTARTTERMAEERRIASIAAGQKVDEIRIYLQNGHTLDQVFQDYGPLPLPSGSKGAMFDVPGLTPFIDTDPLDGPRPVPRSIGTVSIINDETPNEALFGYDFANKCSLPGFGVDINGNGSHTITTGFGSIGAAGYNDQTPWPFPLDLDGDGSDGSKLAPWDNNVVSGFVMLPIVITIQWQGVNGPQRYDLFTIITPIQNTETAR